MIRINAPRCRIISSAGRRRALGLRQSRQLRQNVGEIIRFPAEIARAQFANRQSQWQPLAEETVAQQQTTADFYLANGLIRTRLDVKPTFDRRFSVPAAEVTP